MFSRAPSIAVVQYLGVTIAAAIVHAPPQCHHPPPTKPPSSPLRSATSTMAADVASPGGADFFFKGESGRNTRGLLRLIILCTIAAAAVASRLFSVIRFESIIHECMHQPIAIPPSHANACMRYNRTSMC